MQWNTLERWSPRIWPLTIVIGVSVLIVALYNLCLTVRADRPQLVSTEARIFVNPNANPPELVRFTWGNMGKRSALRGTAILFTITEDGNRHETFEKSEITAAGHSTTLTPTFGYGGAQMRVDMKKYLGLFLACVEYYDEVNNPYQQPFLFRLSTQPTTDTRLDEVPSSTYPHASATCVG